MAFDEQGQADTVERKVSICGRAYDLLVEQAGFAAEDIIFDPNVLAVATGIAEHNGYAKAFIEALPLIKAALPGRPHQRRHLQPVVLVPRQRRRPRGDALGLPVPRGPGRAGHGHRQRRPARGLPGHPGRPAGTGRGRDLRPARGRDRPAGHLRRDRERQRHQARRSTCPGGRPRSRERLSHALVHGIVDFIEADTEEARLHRDPTARRDRGPADGRHEDRRRPVRLRQDVPAAGGEERPGDEALGGLPGAVHGGREGAGAGARGGSTPVAVRARSCWPRSRATCTTSARTSSAWCWAATTTR